MSPTAGLFFLLPLTLSLSLHAHPTAVVSNNATHNATTLKSNATTPNNATGCLIEKACGGMTQTHAKDFCHEVLKSEPTSKTADLKGLAFIALQAASKNASTTSVKIQIWLNDTEAEPALDDGLRACQQAYVDAVDQIADSVNALVSGAHGDVETWMKAAVADIDTCDGGVKGLTLPHAVELTKKNHVTRQLCHVGLGIVHVLARS